jgi:hypothetical protein
LASTNALSISEVHSTEAVAFRPPFRESMSGCRIFAAARTKQQKKLTTPRNARNACNWLTVVGLG